MFSFPIVLPKRKPDGHAFWRRCLTCAHDNDGVDGTDTITSRIFFNERLPSGVRRTVQ